MHISLIDGVSVTYSGQKVELRNKKLSALLGYFALNDKFSETRERIAGLIWSESDETRARASLRQALRQLRILFDRIGFHGFQADKVSVALDEEFVGTDIKNIIALAEAKSVDDNLINRIDFVECLMRGYEDIDPSYRVWLLTARQNYHNRLVRALEAALEHPPISDDSVAKARIARALLNLDPTHEAACRYIMKNRAEIGDVAGALKAYNALWEILGDEYDMEPSETTMNLVADIKSGNVFPNEAAADDNNLAAPLTNLVSLPNSTLQARPMTPKPVLFVGEFLTLDLPSEFFHLVEGFRHSFIASLARFREWRVSEGNLAAAMPADDIAAYNVQTTAYLSDNSLHLVITLKDLSTNTYIWSDRFEFKSERWLDIHHRIIKRITIALNINLSVQRLTELTAERGLPARLYDLWLRGQSMMQSFNPEDWRAADLIFRNMIDEVPDFSPAYSTLVQFGNTAHIAQPGVFRSDTTQTQNLELAKRSVSLDPLDSRAHLCLAWAYAFDDRFNSSIPHFDMAIDLNEYDPWTLISAAQGFAFLGDRNRAAQYSRNALETIYSPNKTHWAYHAGIHFMNGNYEASLDAATRAENSLVNNGAWRAATHFYLGNSGSARREIEHCFEIIRTRWRGDTRPTGDEILSWIMQLFPIRNVSDRERLRRGLIGAGALDI